MTFARRGPLKEYLAPGAPSLGVATNALRIVFLALFGVQVVLALAVGLVVSAWMPMRPSANDLFAVVLLAMAALHLPLAWVLTHAARRSGGKESALSSTVLSAVLSSIPAWFATLMLISGQRPIYLLVVMTLLSVAYAVGFLSTGRAAAIAARPTATVPPATPDAGARP